MSLEQYSDKFELLDKHLKGLPDEELKSVYNQSTQAEIQRGKLLVGAPAEEVQRVCWGSYKVAAIRQLCLRSIEARCVSYVQHLRRMAYTRLRAMRPVSLHPIHDYSPTADPDSQVTANFVQARNDSDETEYDG